MVVFFTFVQPLFYAKVSKFRAKYWIIEQAMSFVNAPLCHICTSFNLLVSLPCFIPGIVFSPNTVSVFLLFFMLSEDRDLCACRLCVCPLLSFQKEWWVVFVGTINSAAVGSAVASADDTN